MTVIKVINGDINMSNIAILGHATRGKEVIEILEMLGGKNVYNLTGDENMAYYILENQEIKGGIAIFGDEPYIFLTLKDFLEKYPYKVGDKILINDDENDVHTISSMHWIDEVNRVAYRIEAIDGMVDAHVWYADEMEPYKRQVSHKEAMRDYIAPKQETNEDLCLFKIDLKNAKASKEIEVILGDYEFVLKDGKTYFVKKKPQYPKNYCDCCQLVGDIHEEDEVDGYKHKLLFAFQRLLRCRDAYWKIAGEELGLGKPWNPLDDGTTHEKYVIQTVNGEITKLNTWCKTRNILELPTAEMRDIFYEHFKDLIEMCKEFI